MGKEGKTLYQPRIDNENVRKLYIMAKEENVPMTVMINRILGKHLKNVKPDTPGCGGNTGR